jgi:hypothetical protein
MIQFYFQVFESQVRSCSDYRMLVQCMDYFSKLYEQGIEDVHRVHYKILDFLDSVLENIFWIRCFMTRYYAVFAHSILNLIDYDFNLFRKYILNNTMYLNTINF